MGKAETVSRMGKGCEERGVLEKIRQQRTVGRRSRPWKKRRRRGRSAEKSKQLKNGGRGKEKTATLCIQKTPPHNNPRRVPVKKKNFCPRGERLVKRQLADQGEKNNRVGEYEVPATVKLNNRREREHKLPL